VVLCAFTGVASTAVTVIVTVVLVVVAAAVVVVVVVIAVVAVVVVAAAVMLMCVCWRCCLCLRLFAMLEVRAPFAAVPSAVQLRKDRRKDRCSSSV
jgi:hypothetical protein